MKRSNISPWGTGKKNYLGLHAEKAKKKRERLSREEMSKKRECFRSM